MLSATRQNKSADFSGTDNAGHFFSPVGIQPKLTIGQPNDKYEQEADAMADQVMRMPQNGIQRACADCEKEKSIQPKRKGNFLKSRIQRMLGIGTKLQAKHQIQRMEGEEEAIQTKPLMMKSDGGGGAASSALTSQLNSSKGSGSPLPASTNNFMSNAFGTDFSNVRVHTGSNAVQMNQGLNARAFTHGSDVYFNKGEYAPASDSGKRLLAHELMHVVQQGGAGIAKKIQRTIDDGHDLVSSRFSQIEELEATFDNERLIRSGDNGFFVKKVQEALIALGFELPRFGADGAFGPETKNAVQQFQSNAGTASDGIIGPITMGLLDQRDATSTPTNGGGSGQGGGSNPRGGGGSGGQTAANCPQNIEFRPFDQFPAHVPQCGSTRAVVQPANLQNVTLSLLQGTVPVDQGSSINQQGNITIGLNQTAGDITVRAEVNLANGGSCHVERGLSVRSHPNGITSTNVDSPPPNPTTHYGATFDHVFSSNDGNVASLDNVAVGERFPNVPNPNGSTHAIRRPVNPFGGTFTLHTSTLSNNASNNWFLTNAGRLNGTKDRITTEKANINVGHFIRSASNNNPRDGALPATMTVLQEMNWFCPQSSAATRWRPVLRLGHSRTLRNDSGTLNFVTTVNGEENIDTYEEPIGVFNVTASPVNVPRSTTTNTRTVTITASTLPDILSSGQQLNFRIIGNARGASIAPDPNNSHQGILTVGTRQGEIRVRVTDSSGRNFDEVRVIIT